MKKLDFVLRDCEGEEHRYETELFSCDEAVSLQLLIAQPLLRAIGKIGAGVAPGFAAIDGKGKTIPEVIAAMDLSGLSEALPEVPRMLEERGGPELIARIFKRTVRIHYAPDAESGKHEMRQALKDSHHRDAAFADGNYLELWQAVAMVLAVNFTRSGRNGFESLKELFSTLTSARSPQATTK